MAKRVTVVQPFSVQLDDGQVRRFGPGEVVPDDLAEHWYVQAQIPAGKAVQADPEAEAEAQRLGEEQAKAAAEQARVNAREAQQQARALEKQAAAEEERKAEAEKAAASTTTAPASVPVDATAVPPPPPATGNERRR